MTGGGLVLYFRFDVDGFNQEIKETNYNAKFADIQDQFFERIKNDFSLSSYIAPVAYKELGIPVDAFAIDDEKLEKCDKMIKYILFEYQKVPIKQLGNKSLHDFGIKVEFCKKISNKENKQICNQFSEGSKIITEEIVWKNMTNNQKIEKFCKNLEEIQVEGKELIIIDPYIFADDNKDYCDMLASIVNKSKAKKVIFITNQKHSEKSCCDMISKNITCEISKQYSEKFHDRFWISDRKKGFCTGTSLNGLGKKISLIMELSDDDVQEIIKLLRKNRCLS